MKKLVALLLTLCMVFTLCAVSASAEATDPHDVTGSVMLYATLKEKQLTALKEAFSKEFPNISFDYYAAGAGTVMTKIATEAQAGQNLCDVVWVGEPTNIMTLKDQGILLPYESPEAAAIADEYKDPDHTYIGARLVVMGIAYNTQLVDEEHIPTKWEDLLDDYFTDQIILTDAVESGTMAYALGALVQNEKYGWNFFEQLSEKQHAELNSSASGTHNDIAAGGYLATIGVDYVTQTLTNSGSPIEFVYPEEDTVVIYGPMAIMKDTKNEAAAKVFCATPIRNDVVREGAKPVSEIHQMEGIDDILMNENTDAYFDKFDELFK